MKQDIFEEFLKRLEKANVSPKLINEIKRLWGENQLESKEAILNAIKETVAAESS